MGFAAIPGVSYTWYDSLTGGTVVRDGDSVNVLSVTKNGATDIHTWYVEPKYAGKLFPRVRVDLESNVNCGEPYPSGCVADGTLLFREDFGGNRVDDPRVSATPLPAGTIDYTFDSDNADSHSSPNSYWLLKYNSNRYGDATGNVSALHVNFADHTHPDDLTRGYMLMVDASDSPSKIYERRIDNLCGGMSQLYFSAWVSNLILNGYSAKPDNPDLKFEITDTAGNVLATYRTGDVNRESAGNFTWKNYGFGFTAPSGHTSITFRIFNASAKNAGNDFVMDDIEVHSCIPSVEIALPSSKDTLICLGSTITLKGRYTDNGNFIKSPNDALAFKWEYSPTGTTSDWTAISPVQTTSSPKELTVEESALTIHDATAADEGYYRIVVSTLADIDNGNCRALSDAIRMRVEKAVAMPDIRATVQPAEGEYINLSSYLDALGNDENTPVSWTPVPPAPALEPGTENTTGRLNTGKLTAPRVYIYRYTVVGQCAEHNPKIYLRTLKKTSSDKTITVRICKDLDISENVQLNQILGVELPGGVYSFGKTNWGNVFTNNITEVTLGNKAGAYIFNARKAWAEAAAYPEYNYDASGSIRRFELTYGNMDVTITLVLVVSD